MDLGPKGIHGIRQETAKQSSGNSKMLMVAMAAPTLQSAFNNRELTWEENTPVEYSSRLPTEPERVALPSIRQVLESGTTHTSAKPF